MEKGRTQLPGPNLIGDIMTRDIVRVPHTMTVKDSAVLMKKNGVGSLLVNEGQNVVGIITETDIVHKVVAQDLSPQNTTVESVMSYPLISIEVDNRVEEAADLMGQNGIRHLAVTQEGKVVGMISMRDLLRPFHLPQERSGS